MRRVVVDAEAVADAVLLADPVESDPGPRRVGDVVVPVVAGRPAGHRALLDAVDEAARLRLPEQRHEALLEGEQVLVHRERLVASHEAAHRVDAEQARRLEHAAHEVVLLPAHGRVLVQHVVEVADVREADPLRREGLLHAPGARRVEGLAQVERVRDRVQHGLGGHVGLARVQRGRELHVVGAHLARERGPLLDREVGIGIALLARRQLLERGRQHADLHELRLERDDGHSWTSGSRPRRTIRRARNARQPTSVRDVAAEPANSPRMARRGADEPRALRRLGRVGGAGGISGQDLADRLRRLDVRLLRPRPLLVPADPDRPRPRPQPDAGGVAARCGARRLRHRRHPLRLSLGHLRPQDRDDLDDLPVLARHRAHRLRDRAAHAARSSAWSPASASAASGRSGTPCSPSPRPSACAGGPRRCSRRASPSASPSPPWWGCSARRSSAGAPSS